MGTKIDLAKKAARIVALKGKQMPSKSSGSPEQNFPNNFDDDIPLEEDEEYDEVEPGEEEYPEENQNNDNEDPNDTLNFLLNNLKPKAGKKASATVGTKITTGGKTTTVSVGTKTAATTKSVGSVVSGCLGKVLGIIGIILLVIILVIVIVMIVISNTGNSSLTFGGYHEAECDYIYVEDDKMYALEDYVKGVVLAELGTSFADLELYKALAVAARTYVLVNAEDCTIESSSYKQNHKDITGATGIELIEQAVDETKGEVLYSNNQLLSLQYDSFCYKEKNSTTYTLSQKNQQIPVEWAESNVWSDDYLNCPCQADDNTNLRCWKDDDPTTEVWQDGGHGNGMSQYGAYYLSSVEGYDYKQILEYYYGENQITMGSTYFISSIAGLEIKDTTSAELLNGKITDFLSSKGNSLENMNNYIHTSVETVGIGTREGVVTAAVTLINYLYDNYNIKLPYYWGGKANTIGIPSYFGTYQRSEYSGSRYYYYKSFDCSGFVSWAIKNGGYNFSSTSTSGFKAYYGHSCNITDSTCVGKPGDLINYRNTTDEAGHVLLIIAVDEENKKYFVAHSGGGNKGVVMQQRDMHAPEGEGNTRIIYMDNYYNNPQNVNPNY